MAVCGSCHGKGVQAQKSALSIPHVCDRCHGTGKLKLTVVDLLPQDHACFLYDDPKFQLDTAVTFLIEGLKQRECCFYTADEHSIEDIKEALARNGINVKKQINDRALNLLTKKETYLANGYFDASEMLNFAKDAVKAATRAGFLAFRGAGEMTWALGEETGCDQVIPYEFLMDEYFHNVKPDITALCQYNIKRFSSGVVQGAIHTHKIVVLPDGQVVANPYYQDDFHKVRDRAHLEIMMNRLKDLVLKN